MKNLLKIISLVLLSSLSLCSCATATEVKDFDYEYYSIIDQTIILHRDFVIDYNDSKENYSQNKDIRSCKLKNKTACDMYHYLTNKSTFKDHQIYAIISSAYRESTLNPRAGSAQYGLFQWNHVRERLYYKTYKRSLKGTSIEQQIDFFLWELKHTETIAYKSLLNSNSFEQASVAMVKKFERSLHQQSDINKQNRIYKKLRK